MSTNIRFPQGPITDATGYVSLEWSEWFQNPQFLSINFTNALGVSSGGTGISSYAIGDLIYASASTTLARLADVATGNALISGGVGVAPSWGKVVLTTHVSGTLPVANGGTGAATLTGVLKGNGTGAVTAAAQLAVADGGTGVGTLTGVLKGNGTSAITAAAQLAVADGGTGVATASANLVFAGPSSGAAAAPAFRSLVPADMTPSTATNSLTGDVPLNNVATYFDGPSIAQGSTGVWFATGTVTVKDTAGVASFDAKLWDGTNVAASARLTIETLNHADAISLSGIFTNPPGNIRISVKDGNSTSGSILFNVTGNSKDSTVSAMRIG